MSYILDALRKSEQQRQRGASPRITAAPLPTTEPTGERGSERLLMMLGGIALVAVGLALGWLRPWQGPHPVSASVPAPAVSSPVAVATAPAVPTPPTTPVSTPTPAVDTGPAKAAPPPPPPAAPVASPVVTSPPPAPVASAPVAPTPASPKASKPAPPPAPAVGKEEPTSSLPKVSITVHAYADAASERVAGINGKFLKEGEEIEPGMRLEKVTPTGVVINYKGKRFSRDVR